MTVNVSKKSVDAETWDPIAKMICNEFAKRFERDPTTFRGQNFRLLYDDLQRVYTPAPKRSSYPQPRTDFRKTLDKAQEEIRKAREGVREQYIHIRPEKTEPQAIIPLPMAKLRQQVAIRTLGDFWRWLKKILLIS